MSDTKFRERSNGLGYAEVEFDNFRSFVDYISDMLDYDSYVWRGQRRATWPLEPTLDRLLRKAEVESTGREEFSEKHLECFKYAVRGRRGANPPSLVDENDWWALGQHHGLATPLLDWSNSPFVAAFFAFDTLDDNQTESRAIYALHQPTVEDFVAEKIKFEMDKYQERQYQGKLGLLDTVLGPPKPLSEIVFVRPLSDENSRLVSQRGLFTRNYTENSLEEWVKQNHPKGDNSLTLIKHIIPNVERTKCLQLLNRMNINPLSLFPDLSGASQYCNLTSVIKSY